MRKFLIGCFIFQANNDLIKFVVLFDVDIKNDFYENKIADNIVFCGMIVVKCIYEWIYGVLVPTNKLYIFKISIRRGIVIEAWGSGSEMKFIPPTPPKGHVTIEQV